MADKISIDALLDLLCELMDEPEGSLTPESILEDVEGWDSLSALTIMAEYDDRFEIVLTPDQLESFTVIDNFIQVVRDQGLLV